MRRFTESVNAKLPLEEPDFVLLRLVQSQAHRVCSRPAGAADGPRPSARKTPLPPSLRKIGCRDAPGRGHPPKLDAVDRGARPPPRPPRQRCWRDPRPSAGNARPTAAAPAAGEEDNRAPRSPRQSGPIAAGRRLRRAPPSHGTSRRVAPPVVVAIAGAQCAARPGVLWHPLAAPEPPCSSPAASTPAPPTSCPGDFAFCLRGRPGSAR